jgi:hypothetical protein
VPNGELEEFLEGPDYLLEEFDDQLVQMLVEILSLLCFSLFGGK